MYRRLFVVSIIVLLLSLAFASAAFAQTGAGNEGDQGTQQNQGQTQNQGQMQNQGGDPGSAFNSLSQGSMNLNAGQRNWYVFRYAGDNSPVQIRLSGSNAQFSVWTQGDIQNASGNFGATANPVGRSSANSNFGGDQYWTGSFNAPGNYYIMVETTNGGQNAGNYTLSVTGSGVSWQGQQGGQNQTGNQQGASSATGQQAGATGAQQGQSGQQAGGLAPQTLPTTGAASALPLLIGGIGALSVAAGAWLRRKK
ncbi:MAG: LPXTG cell wall anchor domain-containing protein [Anaerolineae bacterium]|jgi:LPXTG-motif cell wall-anchored protein|nr:LPXTG cell wall anchor domain-containing protein [Anaerolineae bacterium]